MSATATRVWWGFLVLGNGLSAIAEAGQGHAWWAALFVAMAGAATVVLLVERRR